MRWHITKFLIVARLLAAGGSFLVGAALQPAQLRAQSNAKAPIATIGAGHIGGTIGGLWVKNGHKVFFSSHHPEELKDLVASLGPLAQAGNVDQAGKLCHRREGFTACFRER
jgi:hypothetical protein